MLTLYDNIMKVNNPSWESTTHISVFYLHGYSRCVSKISNLSKFPTSNANIKQVVFDVMNCWFSFNNLWQNLFFSKYSGCPSSGVENYNNIKSKPSNKTGILGEAFDPQKTHPVLGVSGFPLAPGTRCCHLPVSVARHPTWQQTVRWKPPRARCRKDGWKPGKRPWEQVE